MPESKKDEPFKKRFEKRKVFIGRNPYTGEPYFKTKKVQINASEDPDLIPGIEEGLTDKERGELLKEKPSPEQIDRYKARERAEQMEKDWLRAHSKKGRPPIGGAQDN